MDTIKNILGSGSKSNEDSSFSGEGSHLAGSSNNESEGLGSKVPGAFPGSTRSDERGLTGYGDSDTSRTGGGLTGSSGGYGDNATSRLENTGASRGVTGDTSSSGIGASDTSRAGGGLTAPSGSDNTSSGIGAGDSSYTGSSYTGGSGYDNTSSGIGAGDASRPGGGLGAASGYDKNTSRIDDTDTPRTGGGLTGSTGYGSTTSRLGDTDTSRTGGLSGSTGYGSNTSRLDDTDTSRTGGLTGSSGYGGTTSRLDDTSRTGGLTGSSGIGGTSDTTRGYATTDPTTTSTRDTPSTIRDNSSGAVGNTFTERKYPLSSGSDDRDIPGSKYDSHGPHQTETANRLDPNVSGSGYGDNTDSSALGSGVTRGAGSGLGTSSTGTGAYGSRRDDDTSGSRTGYATGGAAAGTAAGAYGASEYGSSRRDDDTTLGDDRHGSKKGGLAGGVAGIAAGGSSAKEYTTKNDDLGPAENTAGPYKSDTFNKADPRVEENPEKARDLLMDLRKNEKGEDQLIVSGAGVDRDHTVSEERRNVKNDRDDEYDGEGKKKSTGSKILGAFGIGKDKDSKKADDDTYDSSRGAGTSDYTSSRDNERSAYGSTTTTSDTYGSRGDTDKYEKRTEPTSHGRRDDDTEDLSSRRDRDRDVDDNDTSGEKKRGGLSGLLHRDNPNKLHKDPPEGYRSKVDTDDTVGGRGHATGGPHYGIDGEIGRSSEVSGYGGSDARQTRNIDDINREGGTRDY